MSWPRKVLKIVYARSEGICEGCGVRAATNVHHRRYKSRRGKDEVVNALHLCGVGNAAGCHQVAHSGEGGEMGWSVSSWYEPARVPVLYRGTLRYLTADGGVTET